MNTKTRYKYLYLYVTTINFKTMKKIILLALAVSIMACKKSNTITNSGSSGITISINDKFKNATLEINGASKADLKATYPVKIGDVIHFTADGGVTTSIQTDKDGNYIGMTKVYGNIDARLYQSGVMVSQTNCYCPADVTYTVK